MISGLRKAAAGILAVCLSAGLTLPAAASTPYDNYVYADNKLFDAPPAATPDRVIDQRDFGTTALKNAQDMFTDASGYLYIADTGNNRILKLDAQFRLVKQYDGFERDGEKHTFSSPSGLYVDETGGLLIADTDNARLVRLDKDGNLLAVYDAPQSKLLPDTFHYTPVKVAGDSAGRIFVASRGFNRGLLELDREGNFVQMLGASKVTYSLMDQLWRMFSTEEQLRRMAAFVPTEYNNLTVDGEDFLLVTSGTSGSDPVRKINAKGTDVLRRELGEPVADVYQSFTSTIKGGSLICDVMSLENSMYAILDQKRARVFAYNQDGEMLFMFGGLGNTYGTLELPSSMVMFGGKFLVLDSARNTIVSYALTEYGSLFFQAQRFTAQNLYDEEKATWEQIYALNENNPIVLRQMGKIAYRQRDMKEALEYFKKAKDRDLYSNAFKFYRRDIISRYFTAGGIVVIVLIVLLIAWRLFIKYSWRKRHPAKEHKGPLRYAFHVIFRPLDGFWDLKREKRGSVKTALGLMAAAGLVFILRTQLTGFIFNGSDPSTANFLVDLATLFVPLLLWVVSIWCVTSLMDGEGSFKDIVTATGYAMTPLVVLIPVGVLLSNVLTQEEGAVPYFLFTLAFIWMAVLIIAGVKQTHNYSMSKALLVILLALLIIAIIVFVVLLCTALLQQMASFASDIYSELINRM